MDQKLGFQDIVKKTFANMEIASALSFSDIIITLSSTFIMGMFIFIVYRKTFQGVLYTQSYNVSLVMVALVTSLIIMTISSNFVLSLGMVGALSIVRFRTAIKDSMDIVFMFWAIAIGIANGAAFYKLSITGTLFIGIIMLLLTSMKSRSAPYLLIINYDESSHTNVLDFMKNVGKYNLKSKSVIRNNIELTIEVRIKHDDVSFMNELSKLNGVKDAVLVSYNGDYIS